MYEYSYYEEKHEFYFQKYILLSRNLLLDLRSKRAFKIEIREQIKCNLHNQSIYLTKAVDDENKSNLSFLKRVYFIFTEKTII